MSQKNMESLLYFEYSEKRKEKFNAELFIEKYEVEPRYINDTNVFTFLCGILEQEESIRLNWWKEALKEKKNEVSTYTFQVKTKKGIQTLNMTMIPMLDSQNEEISYFVGYFS